MFIDADVAALIGLGVSLVSLVLIVIVLFRTTRDPGVQATFQRVEDLTARTDRALRDELASARTEAATAASLLREEVAGSIRAVGDALRATITDLANSQKSQLDGFGVTLAQTKQESSLAAQGLREEVLNGLSALGTTLTETISSALVAQGAKLDEVTKQIVTLTEGNEARQDALKISVETKLTEIRTESVTASVQLREEVSKALKAVGDSMKETLTQMSEVQRERLALVTGSLENMTTQQKQQHEALKGTIETKLETLRTENTEKLEQMRLTVDEKLQTTLEQRLGASFKQVSDSLEQVYKSVGEMQNLATGVGDLKRVLTNVRARGAWGEVVLGGLLEQVLAPEQFAANVEITPGTGRRVEFAVKFPGHSEGDGPLWLPIDSKFPHEAYDRLSKAADHGDSEAVDAAGWELENSVRMAARDIAQKYIAPPYSTDMGVLFLPTEGLYAEIIRRPGLVEALQREFRVSVAGPTTLAAFLSSLRMGFRTLAIQKRSGEVWQVLGAVKTEFIKYTDVMKRVKQRLTQASDEIDKVAIRQRAINQKLKDVETLPEVAATSLLSISVNAESAPDSDDAAAEDAA